MAHAHAEPTEQPTPEKLAKARQSGQVAVSRDLSGALTFAGAWAVFSGTAAAGTGQILGLFRHSLATAARASALGGAPADFAAAGVAALRVLGSTLAPALGVMAALAILAGAMQTGGLFAWRAARPDWARLSPAAGLARLWSPRIFAETTKGLLKVTILVVAAAGSLSWSLGGTVTRLAGAPPSSVLAAVGIFLSRLGIRVALVLIAWGMVDWLQARRRHHRALMMTRDEVRREHKDAEGDPRHRSERQRLHRELGEQRLIDDVRKADFVVVNPEHIAIALRYDRGTDAAPQVVAKGERLAAEAIKRVAREAGVPIYRDVGLARALNELPEGDEIPEALYEAVAQVLRVLWELDQGEPAGSVAHPSTTSTTATTSTVPHRWKRA